VRFHARRGGRSWLWLAALVAICATATGARPSRAQAPRQELRPKLEGKAIAEALRKGGYVILLRHTETDGARPSDVEFDIDDCSTQRNLSEKGRRQAVQIGRAFDELGIAVSNVFSSPYCRCIDTGTLAFGSVVKSEILSVGDRLSGTEKADRGAQVRSMLGTKPPPGENTVLITHTGNLLYTFGLNPRPEGIAHVFQPLVAGPPSYIGMVRPEEWLEAAGLAPGDP
jgi:hypothetical protein